MVYPRRAKHIRQSNLIKPDSLVRADLTLNSTIKTETLEFHIHYLTVLATEDEATVTHSNDTDVTPGIVRIEGETVDETATHIKWWKYDSTTGTLNVKMNAPATADVIILYSLLEKTTV